MPAASLYLFEITMLLILIPIVDGIIYPSLRYFGIDFTPLKKMGVGMLFAMGSVLMAGFMEIERKKYIHTHGYFKQHQFDTKCLRNEHLLSSFSIRAPGNWGSIDLDSR